MHFAGSIIPSSNAISLTVRNICDILRCMSPRLSAGLGGMAAGHKGARASKNQTALLGILFRQKVPWPMGRHLPEAFAPLVIVLHPLSEVHTKLQAYASDCLPPARRPSAGVP